MEEVKMDAIEVPEEVSSEVDKERTDEAKALYFLGTSLRIEDGMGNRSMLFGVFDDKNELRKATAHIPDGEYRVQKLELNRTYRIGYQMS